MHPPNMLNSVVIVVKSPIMDGDAEGVVAQRDNS